MGKRNWFLLVLGLCLGSIGCTSMQKTVTRGATPSPESHRPGALSLFGKSKQGKKPVPPKVLVALGKLREDQSMAPRLHRSARESLLTDALKAYQRALEQSPSNVEGYLGVARIYAKFKEYPKAFEVYKIALEKHPNNAKVWFEYGMVNGRAKNFDLAIMCFRKAEKLNPTERDITRTLGHCLARAGRVSEAVVVFSRVDGKAVAHFNVARMLQHIHRIEEAKQHARMALRYDGQLNEARELLTSLERADQQRQPTTYGSATLPVPPDSLRLGQPGA